MNKTQRIAILIAVVATFLVMILQNQEMEEKRKAAAALRAESERRSPAPLGGERSALRESVTPSEDLAGKASASAELEKPAAPAEAGSSIPPKEEVRTLVVTPEYEAEFSSLGGSLTRFSLNRFYRTPLKEEANRLTLLDEVKKGVRSMNLESITGTEGLFERNFEVVSLPQETDPEAPRTLVYRTQINDWEITKTYRLPPLTPKVADPAEAYGFRLVVTIRNLTTAERELGWRMQGIAGMLADDRDSTFGPLESLTATKEAESDRGAIQREAIRERLGDWDRAGNTWKGASLVRNQADLAWLGMRGRYFASVLRVEKPEASNGVTVTLIPLASEYSQPDGGGEVRTFVPYIEEQRDELAPFIAAQPYSAALTWESVNSRLAPGAAQETGFRFYGGPLEEAPLAFDPVFKYLVTYSAWNIWLMEVISIFLVDVLNAIRSVVGNAGICVILLTFLIKTCLHGLTRKSLKSTHAMQSLQPQLKELKAKYKSDPAKMQSETMRLWRENGVSPMGPCLPMFIQIPIFFSLYGVFSNVFSMRQASFIPGWIDDLSQPDALFILPFTIPLTTWNTFNLLPILYVALQFVQMSMTPKSDDPQQQQMQQTMKIMPLMFMFIFYAMPSGLVLYFTVSAAYTLAEHWFIRKQLLAKEGTQAAAAKAPVAAGKGFKKK